MLEHSTSTMSVLTILLGMADGHAGITTHFSFSGSQTELFF